MLHLLKRHPIPITAYFRHVLAITFAFPPEVLQPFVPKGLTLDTWRGNAFLAIALVQTEHLRPIFLPAFIGRSFFLSGYRIFTRLADAQSLRGLKILRSDTDRMLMVNAGNLLTHYNYRLCDAALEECDNLIHWRVQTSHAEADLDVAAYLADDAAQLPAGSPFSTVAEARRFAGPLPYTFDFEEATGAIIGVRAERQQWSPRPTAVEIKQATFLEREPFCRARPILANAFHVQNVRYQWQRGRRLA
jgi:hypothetical protein